MSTTPTLNGQVIGQAENALRALLLRALSRTGGGTYPQWVALNLTAASGGSVDRDQLVSRMTGGLKIDESAAEAVIAELTASRLLQDLPGQRSVVEFTDAGQARYRQTRAAVDEVTARLFGDLPAEDLATAGRVLTVITARANAELSAA